MKTRWSGGLNKVIKTENIGYSDMVETPTLSFFCGFPPTCPVAMVGFLRSGWTAMLKVGVGNEKEMYGGCHVILFLARLGGLSKIHIV